MTQSAQTATSPTATGLRTIPTTRSTMLMPSLPDGNELERFLGKPPGQYRHKCPSCGRDRRSDRTMSVKVEADSHLVACCHRCGHVVHTRGLNRPPQKTRPHSSQVTESPPRTPETLNEGGQGIWDSAWPITHDSVAGQYLHARRCVLPPPYGDLRWLAHHRHPSGYSGPALVALLTDAISNEPRSLHFTWIQANGKKAELSTPRLLLKGHRKAGCVCRLWPDDEVHEGLGVAEGIETALSLAHGYKPVWSCIDAGNLGSFPVLTGIQTLIISQDRDPAGEGAAAACTARWVASGREVYVTQQSQNDLNDAIQWGVTHAHN